MGGGGGPSGGERETTMLVSGVCMDVYVCICVREKRFFDETVPSDLLDIQNRIWVTSSQNS